MPRAKKTADVPTDRLDEMLARLKLSGIRDQLDSLLDEAARANLSSRETLSMLCEREIARKDHRRIDMALKLAHFPNVKELSAFDFEAQPSIDPKQIRDLAASRWIANGENVLLLGPPGVGKSWLACALAQKACRDGYTVHYARVPRLFADLELAHGDGRFAKLFRTIIRADLLILDDWGPDRLTASHRRDLMEIVEERYGSGATLITSQLTVETWHEVIAEPTFADAILDRLVHNAYRLALDGPSMCKIKAAEAETAAPASETTVSNATATMGKPAKAGKR
jgi:DNA replication protein DnaC